MKVIQHKIFTNRSKSTAKTILKPLGLKQQQNNILKRPQQIMSKINQPIPKKPNAIIMLVHKYEKDKPELNVMQPYTPQNLYLQKECFNQCKLQKMQLYNQDSFKLNLSQKIQFHNVQSSVNCQKNSFKHNEIQVKESIAPKIENPQQIQVNIFDMQYEKENKVINKMPIFVPLEPSVIQIKPICLQFETQKNVYNDYSIAQVHEQQLKYDEIQKQLLNELNHNYRVQIDIFIQLLEQNNKSMLEIILQTHKKQNVQYLQQYQYIKINYLDYLNSQINSKKIQIKFVKEDPHSKTITTDNKTFINNVVLETDHYINVCQNLYDEQYKKFKNPASIIIESLILFEKQFKEIISKSNHVKISKLLYELQDSFRMKARLYLLDYKQIQINFTSAENQIKSFLETKCDVSAFEKNNFLKKMQKATECDQLYEIISTLQTIMHI